MDGRLSQINTTTASIRWCNAHKTPGRDDNDAAPVEVKKVKKEIRAYGKDNGYTYILGGGEGGSVIYGDEAKDVTDAILKILNDKYEN